MLVKIASPVKSSCLFQEFARPPSAINTAGGKFNDGITIILFMTKVRLLYSTMANINNFLLIEKNNLFKRIFGDISGRHFYDDVT